MMPTSAARAPRRLLSINLLVLVVIVAVIAIGLLNLRNADFYSADSFHQRQLKWYLLGLVLAVVTSVVDLHLFYRLAWIGYGLAMVGLVAVLFTDPINNSRRWLPVFGESLQPSEFVKLGLTLALARLLHDQREAKPDVPRLKQLLNLVAPFLVLFAPVLLIFAEPDLGTAIIVTLIGLSMLFFQGVRWRSVLTAVGVVALIFPLAWKFALHDYQKDRVLVWWDPDSLKERALHDPAVKKQLDKAYQPQQAVIAIGSGQFYGKGGQQGHATRQRALPYLHTDFVIATWGEERGFIGATLLLALYYLLVYWSIRVTKAGRDKFQVLTAVGIAATLFWQFFVNVGMVTGLLPVVGVTLPLLSYGGSSVLSICLGLGLLFNIVLRQRAT